MLGRRTAEHTFIVRESVVYKHTKTVLITAEFKIYSVSIMILFYEILFNINSLVQSYTHVTDSARNWDFL